MRFTDALLVGGKIANKGGHPWIHDTSTIPTWMLDNMRNVLGALRSGLTRTTIPVDTPFDVALGMAWLTDERTPTARRSTAPGRYFSVFAPGEALPFQCNAVIPHRTDSDTERRRRDEEIDKYAISTISGISFAHLGEPDPDEAEERAAVMAYLWERRPLLVTSLIPVAVPKAGFELVQLTSEFAKYFAAAMLLDMESTTEP